MPSGQGFIHGKPEFGFPAATKLDSSSAIGDALVGARLWTDPNVLQERDILLGSDDDGARRLVNSIRSRLVENYKQACKVSMNEERKVYGDKSYFRKTAMVDSDSDSGSDTASDELLGEANV